MVVLVVAGRWVEANRRTFSIAASSAARTPGVEIRRRTREVIATEDEAPVREAAAEPPVVASHGLGALALHRVEDPSRSDPHGGVGNRSAPGQRDERRIGRGRGSGCAKVEPPQGEGTGSPIPGGPCGHGTIFSIGRTRIPDAPSSLEAGQEIPDIVRSHDGVDCDHAAVGERDDGRRLETGQQGLELRQPVRRGIHHHVLPGPGR